MTTYRDVNEFAIDTAKQLLDSSTVKSTNKVNQERYKNSLGGELVQHYFKISNPKGVIGTHPQHKGFKWWMYGEILSEMLNLDPPIMYKYRPDLFDKHYDLLEDGRMQYTYSNRFVEFGQFVNLYRRLKDNPNSKRAVVDIYTPYDTAPDRADAPCTTMYHFLHRDGKLNMSVFMRSWDFMGGAKTYDFALSSFIQQGVCSWLDMEPGDLAIYANSLHFYNRDREVLEDLVENGDSTLRSKELIVDGNLGIKDFYDDLRKVKAAEEAAYNGNIIRAKKLKEELTTNIFKDMTDVWIRKNDNRH